MCLQQYDSVRLYLDSKKTLQDRIVAIDLLIDQAILLMADTVEGSGGNIAMYELDDGQVRIKTTYRSIQDVSNGITALEQMKIRYQNRLYGRKIILSSSGNFHGYSRFGRW